MPAGRPKATDNAALTATFATLRRMLKHEGRALAVTADTATDLTLSSKTKVDRIGRPLFVAAVQIKKRYVSYHLMPVYGIPALLEQLSPELRKRMHGKGCFNFATIEPGQIDELAALTREGLARFKNVKLPWEA